MPRGGGAEAGHPVITESVCGYDTYVPGGPDQGIDTLVCANGVSGVFLGSQN